MDDQVELKPDQRRAWILLVLVPLPVWDGDMRNVFGCAVLFVAAVLYALAYNFFWSRRNSELRVMFDSAVIAVLGGLVVLAPAMQ